MAKGHLETPQTFFSNFCLRIELIILSFVNNHVCNLEQDIQPAIQWS